MNALFRRSLRFSLRAVFVVLLVIAVWLGMNVREARQQLVAVKWVKAHGGNVTYDYELQGAFTGLSVYAARRHLLADIIGDDYCQNVIVVHLQGAHLDDLSPLVGMPELKCLILFNTTVPDDAMRAFQDVHPDCQILH